jgi:hypothetical protein
MTGLAVAAVVLGGFGCDKPAATDAAGSASSTASAVVSVAASVTSAAPVEKPAADKPSHPCPEGSSGEGTLKKPCEASGGARMMDAKWSGKMRKSGPLFRVKNTSKLEISYGIIFVYFYDKAGKQITMDDGDEKRSFRSCGGKIFGGAMKPGEKVGLYFSCVKKKHVPEGTTAIEAELKMVGFTAKSGTNADTFWRNKDLVPVKRPKGGIK